MMLQAQGGIQAQIKNLATLAIFVILPIGLNGCILLWPILWPVNKKNAIGTYQSVLEDGTPGLPDGGSEILELKADGKCKQEITLKDGRYFFTQGVWEWRSDGGYAGRRVLISGVYSIIEDGKVLSEFENTKGIYQSFPVWRTSTGRVALGSDEGPHYEKK